MAKRGRKKARTPAKRRERKLPDVPRMEATPESMMKKIFLVGPGNDPVLGESPIGVMVARKIITATDEHHLKDVAKLWKFRHGDPSPATIRERKSPSLFDSEAKTRSYHAAVTAVGTAWAAIIDVAVYNHHPRWLLASCGLLTASEDDRLRQGQFSAGLASLSNLWGMRIYTT